jgi:hypothetical protein
METYRKWVSIIGLEAVRGNKNVWPVPGIKSLFQGRPFRRLNYNISAALAHKMNAIRMSRNECSLKQFYSSLLCLSLTTKPNSRWNMKQKWLERAHSRHNVVTPEKLEPTVWFTILNFSLQSALSSNRDYFSQMCFSFTIFCQYIILL